MMKMDPKDHEIVQLLDNLYVLHQLFKKYRFIYGNNGRIKTSFNEYLILMMLKNGEKCSIREIRNSIGMNKHNMSYLTDKLVDRKLIKRLPEMSDRRLINIIITDKGLNYLDMWHREKIKETRITFSYFSDSEYEKIRKSLENILKVFSKLRD